MLKTLRTIGGVRVRATRAFASIPTAYKAHLDTSYLNDPTISALAPNPTPRILVTGACGQIGTELVPAMRARYGVDNVIASDVIIPSRREASDGKFLYVDVLDYGSIARAVVEEGITQVVHNSSLLSAVGEKKPLKALQVNLIGFQNMLEIARMYDLRIFAPSTIATFGPSSELVDTPDLTIMRPTTIYGITKLHLELLGEYYKNKFGIDFRTVRFPGIISSQAQPGGGTTDWAVSIFYDALRKGRFECFLSEDTRLPMMHMSDCVRATIGLLEADSRLLKQRTYNVTALSFSPAELAAEIVKHIPDFEISYAPDYRQDIAESWPRSLDDSRAREDWAWAHQMDIEDIVSSMLFDLGKKTVAETDQMRTGTSKAEKLVTPKVYMARN